VLGTNLTMSIIAIALLGAPGAGKGTIAGRIVAVTSYIHLSTGDMLREAIKEETPVGHKAKSYMDNGDLVPDDVILNIVMGRLDQSKGNSHYLFDGFPRTLIQAQLLDKHFVERNAEVRHVFFLQVSRDVTIDRLEGRRICRKCGANFHVRNIPPKVEGICDYCGGELYQRADDSEETILNRLEVFHQQTAGLVRYYDDKRILVRVDSSRQPDETCADIVKVLNSVKHSGSVSRAEDDNN